MKKYILFSLLLLSTLAKGQITLSWPLNRSVFQRDNTSTNGGKANVTFVGQSTVSTSTYTHQYQLVTLDKDGNVSSSSSWTNITNFGGGRTFNFDLTVYTGWYILYVRVTSGGFQYGGTGSVKFGVGEVILIAGQSNAQGSGSVSPPSPNGSGTTYDCVNSNSEQLFCKMSIAPFPTFGKMESNSRVGPNGGEVWAYQRLGNSIADSESGSGRVVPTLFFNVGASGTSAENWSYTATDQTAYTTNPLWGDTHCNSSAVAGSENNGQGQPYIAMKNTLNYYHSLLGIRGVIWHQGESDTFIENELATDGNPSTNYSNSDYYNRLNNVIDKSRLHFNANLAWAISNVSRYYLSGSSTYITSPTNIISQQGTSRSNKSGVDAAYDSDAIYQNNKRQSDSLHFAPAGLSILADQYYSNFSSLKAKTPVLAATVPIINVVPNGSGGGTLSVANGYSEYRWTQNDGNYKDVNCSSSPNPCSNSITVSSSSGSWRCYIKDSNGNFMLTGKVTTPIPLSNARIANEGLIEDISAIKSSVFPNPSSQEFETQIIFELKENAANLKMEIIDDIGNIVKVITNGAHAKGEYRYPFSISNLKKPISSYYYRITTDGFVETKRFIVTK